MSTKHALTAAALLLALAGWAAAQPQAELNIGFGGNFPFWKSFAYTHAYSPAFLYAPTAVTSGRQSLSLGAGSIAGGTVGVAGVFGHWGVSLTYVAFSPDVSGTTSTDAVAVSYTSSQPPAYTPTPVSLAAEIPMADPSGELHERTVSLDGFYRLRLPSWLTLDLSAGLTWFSIDGEIGTLDYWKFWLGGHSVLFSQQYAMIMTVDTINRIGGNVGAALNVHIGTNAAVWAEARWYLAAPAAAHPTFQPVDNEAVLVAYDAAADVIPDGGLKINPGFFRVGAGIKLVF